MGCLEVRTENIYIYIFFFPELITFKALTEIEL